MKKLSLSFLLFLAIFVSSCSKENNSPAIDVPENGFVAYLNNVDNQQSTTNKDGITQKTTIDQNKAITWEYEDEISINGVDYVTNFEGSGSQWYAVFVPKGTPAKNSVFHAFYPNSIQDKQNYVTGSVPAGFEFTPTSSNTKANNLYLYATCGSEKRLDFVCIVGVLDIAIPYTYGQKGKQSIEVSSIEVTTDKKINGKFSVNQGIGTTGAGRQKYDMIIEQDASVNNSGTNKITITPPSGSNFVSDNRIFVPIPVNTYDFIKIVLNVVGGEPITKTAPQNYDKDHPEATSDITIASNVNYTVIIH